MEKRQAPSARTGMLFTFFNLQAHLGRLSGARETRGGIDINSWLREREADEQLRRWRTGHTYTHTSVLTHIIFLSRCQATPLNLCRWQGESTPCIQPAAHLLTSKSPPGTLAPLHSCFLTVMKEHWKAASPGLVSISIYVSHSCQGFSTTIQNKVI